MSNQRDVAKRAGISSASVSRYLNNPESVSPKTASRIKDAIDELGYRIDYSAQSLKTGRFFRIGIIAASFGPFYWEILSAIEEVLAQSGFYVNIYFTRKTHTDNKYRTFNMNMIQNRQVDGFIIFPLLTKTDDAIIDKLRVMNEPFVVVDRNLADESVYQVGMDNYQAGKTAARALLDTGHRKFLFIWGLKDISSARNRYQGFRDELQKEGITITENAEIPGLFDAEETYTYTKKHFSEFPEFDAVFASNDNSAVGFIRAASECGKVSPRDYSIIGFDNTQIAPFISPPLSSFSQPLTQIGHTAAKMLLTLINGDTPDTHRVVLSPALIERESIQAR